MDDPALIDKIFPSSAVVAEESAPPRMVRSARSGPSRRSGSSSTSSSPVSSPESSLASSGHPVSSSSSMSEPVIHREPVQPKKKGLMTRLMMAGSKEYNEEGYKAAKRHAASKIRNPLPRCGKKLSDMVSETVKCIVRTIVFIIVIFALFLLICLVVCGAMHWGVAVGLFVVLIIIIWISMASLSSHLERFLTKNSHLLRGELTKWTSELESSLPQIFDESLDVYLESKSNKC